MTSTRSKRRAGCSSTACFPAKPPSVRPLARSASSVWPPRRSAWACQSKVSRKSSRGPRPFPSWSCSTRSWGMTHSSAWRGSWSSGHGAMARKSGGCRRSTISLGKLDALSYELQGRFLELTVEEIRERRTADRRPARGLA